MTDKNTPDGSDATTRLREAITGIPDAYVAPADDGRPQRIFVRCNTIEAVTEVVSQFAEFKRAYHSTLPTEIEIEKPSADPRGFLVTIDIVEV